MAIGKADAAAMSALPGWLQRVLAWNTHRSSECESSVCHFSTLKGLKTNETFGKVCVPSVHYLGVGTIASSFVAP